MTRICIYGAGAIGGYLGGQLVRAGGADVSLVARGAHLEAMRARGLRLQTSDGEVACHPRVTDDAATLGPQDYVIVALKAPAAVAAAEALRPLLGPDTAVVPAVNGIPWWYFHGFDGPLRDHQLRSVDPDGVQWRVIGPERAIGCVVHPATEVVEPGVIRHLEGNRFSLGEPDGTKSDRVRHLASILEAAGLAAPIRMQIRNEIWVKLWGNLSFNPISALTRATLDVITTDPGTRGISVAMMQEAKAIGERLGVRFGVTLDARIAGATAVGAHRTSMLQDIERGRPAEIDALVTVVQELGALVGVPTPTIDLVLALVQQCGRVHGSYR